MLRIILLAFGALLVLQGCADTRFQPGGGNADIRFHAMVADSEGHPLDPATKESFDAVADAAQTNYRAYVAAAFAHMDGYFTGDYLAGNPDGAKVRRILIHVHGGMNNFSGAMETVVNTYRRIRDEPAAEDRYYPFFICWDSDGLSTFGQHLFRVSQGQDQPWLTSSVCPLTATVDIASGIVESPITWYRQFTAIDLPAGLRRGNLNREDLADPELNPKVLKDRHIDVGLGADQRSRWSMALSAALYFPTLPFKLITNPLVCGLGKPAWEMMQRRTDNVFHINDEFKLTPEALTLLDRKWVRNAARGTAAVFMECLHDHLQAMARQEPDVHYEIMLVGHSMGSIVINKLLLLYQDLPIRRIVYMAPACSIQEAAISVVPFVQRMNAKLPGPDNAPQEFSALQRGQLQRSHYTQFWLLTLHPQAEKSESEAFELVPRGSLLEWVDNFYSSPPSATDRRLGAWENVLSAIDPLLPISGDLHIKGFGFRGDSYPREHPDFNRCPFWTRAFREIPAGNTVVGDQDGYYSRMLW